VHNFEKKKMDNDHADSPFVHDELVQVSVRRADLSELVKINHDLLNMMRCCYTAALKDSAKTATNDFFKCLFTFEKCDPEWTELLQKGTYSRFLNYFASLLTS
jgi:hypothetical protein